MKILIGHNFYQYQGGEEAVLASERNLLTTHGHQIIPYTRSSDEIAQFTPLQTLKLPFTTIWSRESYRDIQQIIHTEKPDIAHFHNTLPLISPSAYYACQDAGVPVVQTLHNYRLMCLPATFYRDKNVCEQCLGKKFLYPGIIHKCYRDSRAQSTVVAAMLAYHHAQGTWRSQVNIFIALTQFAKEKFIQGGLPAEKIAIKPNFLEDPGKPDLNERKYAVYIGRLSKEKGILQLLQAWKKFPYLPLKIVGTGPLENDLKEFIQSQNLKQVELSGFIPQKEVIQLLKFAQFLIFPTQVYESFGRVIIEAYSCGIPVVASRIGAVAELVIDGKTGLLFNPRDIDDLATKIKWMTSHPHDIKQMGENARQEYEQKYTPEANYRQLMNIYEIALNRT